MTALRAIPIAADLFTRQSRPLLGLLLIGFCFNTGDKHVWAQDTAENSLAAWLRPLVYVINDEPPAKEAAEEPEFRLSRLTEITQIIVYHNSSISIDQSIQVSLVDEEGKTFGPWQTAPRRWNDRIYPSVREVQPNVTVPRGNYRLVNSHPESWLQNGRSRNRGFSQVFGFVATEEGGIPVPQLPISPEIGAPEKETEPLREMMLDQVAIRLPSRFRISLVPREREFGVPLELAVASEEGASPSGLSISASLQPDRGAGMQWFFDAFDASFRGQMETEIAGQEATVFDFITSDDAQIGQLIFLVGPDEDSSVICVAAWNISDRWEATRQQIASLIATAKASPGSAPEITVAPATTAPSKETAASAFTYERGQRYRHPQGLFELEVPDGWQIKPGYRSTVPDAGFDSFMSESGDYVLTISRNAQAAQNAEQAARRWIVAKWSTDGQTGAIAHQLRISGLPATCLAYRSATPRAIFRLAIWDRTFWQIINVIAPGDAPLEQLPPPILALFEKLAFQPNFAAPDPYANVPANAQRGRSLMNLKPLEQLTRDFAIQAFERGVLVQDLVRNQEWFVPAEPDSGFHPISDAEIFLQKHGDTAKALGKPISRQAMLADFRLGLQVYEGGVLIHDPLQGKIWTWQHPKRSSSAR